MSSTTKPKILSKSRLFQGNDAGPHLAVLTTGLRPDGEHEYVRFRIPGSTEILRAGYLPDALRESAVIFSSHPEGPDELMRELVITAAVRGPGQDTLARVIKAGKDLTPYLISDMLVEPKVSPEEVSEGKLHELDVKMLLEFASRTRNVDAAGNRLPIVTLDEYASFRHKPVGEAGARDGGDAGNGAGDALPDAHEGDV